MADEAPLLAGVELGGTKCVCVLASGPDAVRETVRLPTTTPQETLAAIAGVLDRWREGPGYEALGVASFGPLELDPRAADHGRIVNTTKPGWNGADLRGLRRASAMPVAIDTDVNGAALAEGLWGAARGLRSFAYITIGTGIGVGSIVDGRPVRGLGHSEAGHLRIKRAPGDDWPGICAFHGDCVEGLASGPAIAARAGVAAEALAPGHPDWTPVVEVVAGLLHNLVLTTAPERIMIGGGVADRQPHLFPRLRAALLDSLAGYGAAPRIAADIDAFIVPPGLGERAGWLGAIAVARSAL